MKDKKRQKKQSDLEGRGDQLLMVLVGELERFKKLTAEVASNGRPLAQQLQGLGELRRSADGLSEAAKGLQKNYEKRQKLVEPTDAAQRPEAPEKPVKPTRRKADKAVLRRKP